MKIRRAIVLLVLFAGGAFAAEPYEYWTFDNDAAGKAFGANWENSGIFESVWNYGGPDTISADGAGSLVISNHPGQVYRKLPDAGTANADASLDQYAEPFTSGVFRLEMDFSSWALDSAAVGSDMTFAALNQNSGTTIAGIRLQVFDSSTARIQLFGDYAGTAAGYRNFEFGLTNAVAVSAAIEFDFDNGTATYSTNGVQTHSFTDFEATQLGQIQFNTDGVWPVTSTVIIDQMGLLGPDTVQPVLAVDFDGASITNNRYIGGTNFVLNTTTETLGGSHYTGQPIYAGIEHIVSGSVSNTPASLTFAAHQNDTWGHGSARIQWNGIVDQTGLYAAGDISTAVCMFKKEDFLNGMDAGTIFMHATNDTLSATVDFDPQDQLESSSFRWVVQDAGQYYVSTATNFIADLAGDGSPLTADALDLSWFEYNPESDVTSISTAATPTLENIQAFGFWMQATVKTNNGVRTYPDFRVLDFSAAASKSAVSPTSLWSDWVLGYPGVGANNGLQDHGDSDGLDNLTEYAFGGDPSDGDSMGNVPVQSQVVDGGTNYFEYVYYEREDAGDRGLASILEVGTDLVFTNWIAGDYEVGRGASTEAGFDVVTNRIPTDTEAMQFIRLQIEFTP